MKAVTHLEKVITGEVSAVTHLEKVIAEEATAVTYTEKVITGEATPITHLQRVIAGIESPVTHLEQVWASAEPQPTEKEYTGAVPVTITADGTPLIDYLISGNMSQSGTPSPENPITPQECGERTANLFVGDYSQFDNTGGTGTTYAYFKIDEDFTLSFKARNNLTVPQDYYVGISANGGNNSSGVTWAIGSNNTIAAGDVRTVKSSTNNYHCFSFYPKNQNTFDWLVENFEVMLNSGSTAIPYEPYGYKIPISSGGTTTPVYLGEVETTRRIKKLVLDGTESWYEGTSNYYIFIDVSGRGEGIPNSTALSTHTESGVVVNNNGTALFFKKSVFVHSSLADFKAYLAAQYAAGTPVCVWYVLATPTTGIVNEPIRKIGDYADTLSKAQAGVSIPTNNGSTTVDVDTTLKPSEVYIKYMGV